MKASFLQEINTMTVRFAKDCEKSKIMEIWKENFNEDNIYLSFWFSNYYSPKNTVVCANDKEIWGAVHFIECFLSDDKSAYVCGLSVNKEHRGKNIASKMLDYLHNYLANQGFSYCFLMPSISESFYKRFGYFEIIKGVDKTLTRGTCEPFCVHYGGEKNVYDLFCKKFDVSLKRNEGYFDKIRSLYKQYNGDVLCVNRNGEDIGYFVYGIENGITAIYESVFLTDDKESVIYNYFKRDVKEKRLPVMVKGLCKEFNFKSSVIFMH